MTYFPDLTEHTYTTFPRRSGVLNVGWLGRSHPFLAGDSPDSFKVALKSLCESPILLHRGFHQCELCEPGEQFQGNGQIRIEDQNGQIYSAPTMIYHYVTAHSYRPPEEFIEAVLNPKRIVSETSL